MIAGTLVPALDRFPDDAEHWKARIAETLKNLVIYDELPAGREGPIEKDL